MSMAQVITVICDAHLEDGGGEVPATPYQLGYRAGGGAWEWVTVDLCPDHAAPLEGVLTATAAMGRVFDPRAEGVAGKGSPAAGEGVSCPVCGRDYASRASAASHIRQVHPDVSVAAVLPAGRKQTPADCPVCGKRLAGRQGLASHVKGSHGTTLREVEAAEIQSAASSPSRRGRKAS